MGEISIWKLLIVVLLIVLLFGTKKLGSLGTDLGAALKGFKKAMNDVDEKNDGAQSATVVAEQTKVLNDDRQK
ncbi:twin-arginine translocase TatA/TatE family subunit [Leminorella grimontii]|uniref:twin-arginine translocase TatA/TatE family subunit n=1 Tax=Leminorella grimontii TaxID=82981 RepID=UPI003BB97D7B